MELWSYGGEEIKREDAKARTLGSGSRTLDPDRSIWTSRKAGSSGRERNFPGNLIDPK